MRIFLLAWNPNRWIWETLSKDIEEIDQTGFMTRAWSVGKRRDLPIGSRVFVMRLGSEPKGIVGSGYALTEPSLSLHWDQERASQGEKNLSAQFQFDYLSKVPIISLLELQQPPFSQVNWTPQSSGMEIPAEVATLLENKWGEFTSGHDFPEEVLRTITYTEGATKQVLVNAYERNRKAREACIGFHGSRCQVCNVLLDEFYGEDFEGFIHVHHLRPLSEVSESHEIDPIKDLVPVCPNCHAIIHRRSPPYSIQEMRELIKNANRLTMASEISKIPI